MKRLIVTLIALCLATSVFAGGKECNMKEHAAKNVELNGTLTPAASANAKAVFHVANSDQTYTVCEKTKASILKLSSEGQLHVKGKVVNCAGDGKEELFIESANKI